MAAIEAYYHGYVHLVVVALEVAAATIIVVAAAHALWGFARHFLGRDVEATDARRMDIRHAFARSLLLALDLTIGADVLKAALGTTWEAVVRTGAVVLIRVVLTLVIEHELSADARREG